MKNKLTPLKSAWRLAAILALSSAALHLGPASAQQVLELVPGQPPSKSTAISALATKPGETLRIENLKINDDNPTVVNLELRRSEVVGADTQYIVVDDKGTRTFPLADSAHFVGALEGVADSYVFATVSPQGEIRSIIHRGKETLVNELLPISSSSGGRVTSRMVDHQKDFVDREFSCGVTPNFMQTDPSQRKLAIQELLKTGEARPTQDIEEKAGTPRRADIIIDSDYEFFQKFGSEAAAFTYITNLFTYVGSRYQAEVSTRFNLKQIWIRTTSADPWTATSTSPMLDELQAYWNAGSNASIPRHHVHLISGKSAGGGIAYVGSLSRPDIAYGVSGSISGNFNPSSPQVIWDSVVVAHEIGHAFGSSHSHDYDNPYIAPSPNIGGGPIDCCYAGNATSQCGIALGGGNRTGYLPGFSSTTGGGAGQGNGTIMSYCHLLTGGMSNIAWTFGTGHPYGVNPGRVPTVMSNQAQSKLPTDVSGTFDLLVSKSGTGTVTSSPAGINCGSDCGEAYASGTTVTLSATPGSGYSFSGWSGDCSGTGSCTVTMNSYKSVTATFTAIPMGILSVAKIGTGSGTVTRSGGALNCGSTCTETFTPGSIATLIAAPAAGSSFAGWSGACTGAGSCTFTVNANTTVNAQFNLNSGGNTVTPLLQTNLGGAAGSVRHFSVTVPAGARNLVIQTGGGTGDADLYVKLGQVPTTASYDCRPYLLGNYETCTFPTPAAGTYYIMLAGYAAFSGITLNVSYQKPTLDLSPIINLLLN